MLTASAITFSAYAAEAGSPRKEESDRAESVEDYRSLVLNLAFKEKTRQEEAVKRHQYFAYLGQLDENGDFEDQDLEDKIDWYGELAEIAEKNVESLFSDLASIVKNKIVPQGKSVDFYRSKYTNTLAPFQELARSIDERLKSLPDIAPLLGEQKIAENEQEVLQAFVEEGAAEDNAKVAVDLLSGRQSVTSLLAGIVQEEMKKASGKDK